MSNLDRRRFLRLMAGSVGGTLLSTSLVGCGSFSDFDGGDGTFPVLPSGYRFHRLKSSGATLGGAGRSIELDYLYGGVHLGANGVVTLEGRDAARRGGIFQMGVDFSGSTPRLDWERTALLVGDTLRDGRVVSTYESFDVDDRGSIAAVIEADGSNAEQHYGGGLYLDEAHSGFEPVLLAGDHFAAGELYTTGILGDVDLHDDLDMLLVAHHDSTSDARQARHSVVHLPGASTSAANALVTSGDVVDGTDDILGDIGLVDLHDDGAYAYQAQTEPLAFATTMAAMGSTTPSSARILTSNVTTPAEHVLLGAGAVAPAAEADGDVNYGPRVGPGGRVVTIHDLGDEREALLVDGTLLLRSGDEGPRGGTILGFGPGTIGHDGAIYYLLYWRPRSSDSVVHSLMSFDGSEHRTLLSTGHSTSDGSAPIRGILFGTSTEHVDAAHRIVLLCDFDDDTMSVVVGLPA